VVSQTSTVSPDAIHFGAFQKSSDSRESEKKKVTPTNDSNDICIPRRPSVPLPNNISLMKNRGAF
jgi:hypothetical protein